MKNSTIIASLTFQALQSLSKFKRGALLASSHKQQKGILKAVRFLIASGNIKEAKVMLYAWKIENTSYKLVLNLQAA